MRERIRSPVCKSEKHTSIVTTNTPFSSGVPHAMVGTACFALSPVDGLFRHRSGNYDLPPSSRTKRRLDVSVRRQHRGARTTRLQPSACCAVVIRRTFHVPDLTPRAATASRPAYRDDRETPLMTRRDGINIREVWRAGIGVPITKYCKYCSNHGSHGERANQSVSETSIDSSDQRFDVAANTHLRKCMRVRVASCIASIQTAR